MGKETDRKKEGVVEGTHEMWRGRAGESGRKNPKRERERKSGVDRQKEEERDKDKPRGVFHDVTGTDLFLLRNTRAEHSTLASILCECKAI